MSGTSRQNVLWGVIVAVLVAAVLLQGYYLVRAFHRLDEVEAGRVTAAATVPRAESQQTEDDWDSLLDRMPGFDPQSWDPFQEMDRMRQEMDRLFERAMGRFHWSPRFQQLAEDARITPTLDLIEEDGAYVVRVDMPGVREGTIDVRLEGQTLTISGSRSEQARRMNESGALRVERRMGRFERSMRLPSPVDIDSLQTAYRDGVLEVRVNKAV